MKNYNKHCLFNFSRDQPKRLCRNLPKSLVDALHLRERQKYADLLSEVLYACAKGTKQKKFLRCFHEAASWRDWNEDAVCKSVLCRTESMAASADCAHANHLQQKGDVSKRLRKYTIRSRHSPLLTRKVTLVWTLKFAVVLWNDWTGGQSSVIGKQHSQLHGIG